MTLTNLNKYLNEPKYWLLAIATGLIVIHITLASRSGNSDFSGTMFLVWGIVIYLLWEKKEKIPLESDILSTGVGVILMSLILIKSSAVVGYDYFLRIFPLLATLSIGLMASGFKGLKTYLPQGIIFLWVAIPPGAILKIIDLSLLTAKTSALILHYTGYNVTRQGLFLRLPTGSVEVYDGCAGANIIHQLLGLSLIFLLMFPTNLTQKIVLPLAAIFIAFFLNSIRVALMAVLISYSTKDSFEYWHQGDGSLIFSMIAVGLFGIFCWLTVLRTPPQDNNTQNC